jgi:LysM repeat protein
MGGSIQKLTIATYQDSNYESRIKSGAFQAFINPTSFSMTYKTELAKEQSQGASKADLKYVASPPSDLLLEFLFDGTGVTEANSGNKLVNTIAEKLGKGSAFTKKAVSEQIKAFYEATGQLEGSIHKPHNVIINWGDFEFKGILSELTIEYKLFNNEGMALRAIGKAKFSESISQKLEAETKKTNSPDLTHKRTVKAGDTLPLMTQSIYGDSKYYLEVAKVNGLINFRQLTPGQELFFPPIEKTS